MSRTRQDPPRPGTRRVAGVVTLGVVASELTDGVIVLARLTLGDATALVAGEDDDIVGRLAGGRSTLATAEDHIRACAAAWDDDRDRPVGKLAWGIRDVATGELAGTAEVQLVLPGLVDGAANLSYSVFPRWRGRRYGARAVGLMCDFLAGATTAEVAVLRIDCDNARSLQVAEDSGFRPNQELAGPGASMLWFSRTLPQR